jgi:hypothetical protein
MNKYVRINWPHTQEVLEFVYKHLDKWEDVYEACDGETYFIKEELAKEIFKDGIPED